MPVMHVFGVNSSTAGRDPAGCYYECPVYSRPSHSSAVTAVQLKTAVAPAQCVVRGVALLCAAN